MKKYAIPLLLICTSFLRSQVCAQEKVHVITKTIERIFDQSQCSRLEVQAENATVTVHGWTGQHVKVELKLIAKALSKTKATEEQGYQRYIFEKKKEAIYLKNYFLKPEGQGKLNTLLSAVYVVWLPKSVESLKVINKHGDISLDGLSTNINVDVKYGNISLRSISGIGSYTGYFGDLTIENIDGKQRFDLSHMTASLSNIRGYLSVSSQLGDLNIWDYDMVKSISVTSKKSDIKLTNPRTDLHNYAFEASFGDILINGSKIETEKTIDLEKSSWSGGQTGQAPIDIKTSFGTITLKKR